MSVVMAFRPERLDLGLLCLKVCYGSDDVGAHGLQWLDSAVWATGEEWLQKGLSRQKKMLWKQCLRSPRLPDARASRLGPGAGAAPEGSVANNALLWKRRFRSPVPPDAQVGRVGYGAGPGIE